ncbi:MAG: DUF1566 domain-containing protein [Desulfuromonadales bacterium]|nr:DUF1566 domain-containing protein [Desulfuromonadales bacterium]
MNRFIIISLFIFFIFNAQLLNANSVHAVTIALPQTGQASCWDESGLSIDCARTGQDGELQMGLTWPSPRFVDNSDGTITDNLTGLIWIKNANCFGKQTWFNALAAVNILNSGMCGLSDGSNPGYWRLPSILELEGLVDASRSNPALPVDNPFINIQPQDLTYLFYWSSSTYTDGIINWVVNILGGGVNYHYGGSNYVLAVHSGADATAPAPPPKSGITLSYYLGDDGDLQPGVIWPSPRFVDNSDGTITDNLTGLIWLKNADCFGKQTWSNALKNSNLMASGSCGLTDNSKVGDWRLPNKNELWSLVDFGHNTPALPTAHPFMAVGDRYWSSTTHSYESTKAWDVLFSTGHVNYNPKVNLTYVWPVRGGKSGTLKYSLNVSTQGDGNGTMTSSPSGINCETGSISGCSYEFIENKIINLLQTPAWNSMFAGWGGACTGTGNCNLTMDASKSTSARFNPNLTVKLVDTTTSYHSTLQNAYDNALGKSVKLQAQKFTFYESLIFDQSIIATLEGGMDVSFGQNVGDTIISLVNGPLIISNGKLIVKNVRIQ